MLSERPPEKIQKMIEDIRIPAGATAAATGH